MRHRVLGEFETPSALLEAAAKLRVENLGELDAYTPYPVHGLEEALGLPPSQMPKIAFAGGVTGLLVGYGGQFFTQVIDYPINVGGRPPHSPLAFVPISFELMVLFSALSIVFGLLFLAKLPRPHHPVFEVEAFRSASTHAFWVSVRPHAAVDPQAVVRRLEGWGARSVSVLAPEEES